MLMCDLEIEYDDYVWECEQNGTNPLSLEEWWESLE